MNKIIYRKAQEADVPAIKELTDYMLRRTGLGVATTDKITKLVTSPNSYLLLAHDGEYLVGFTCGILHENIFNNVLRVSDIGVFVMPTHRNNNIAKGLIERLEDWARENRATQLWLGQTTGDNPDRVISLYNQLGYQTRGFNCFKEL
jgi:GNAT superfamily N-acetyltransferase